MKKEGTHVQDHDQHLAACRDDVEQCNDANPPKRVNENRIKICKYFVCTPSVASSLHDSHLIYKSGVLQLSSMQGNWGVINYTENISCEIHSLIHPLRIDLSAQGPAACTFQRKNDRAMF